MSRAEAHGTGAQIVVIGGGRTIWSVAYGLRRREAKLPIARETTMWAAQGTRALGAISRMDNRLPALDPAPQERGLILLRAGFRRSKLLKLLLAVIRRSSAHEPCQQR